MTVDSIVQLIIGLFTLIGALGAAWIARDSRRQVSAIRVATTENHHAHQPPTIPDRIDTVQQSISGLAATVEAHHEEQQRRNDQQDERLARGMVEFARLDRTIRHYHPEAGS